MMTKHKSKRIIFLKQMSIVPLFIFLLLLSCNKKAESVENSLRKVATTNQDSNKNNSKPEFKGGMEAFYKFVGENYSVPKGFTGKGKIYMKFMVEKDGSLSNIEIIKDAGFGTGEEAIRVLKMCPKWIPATENGKAVKVQYSLPISLQSEG